MYKKFITTDPIVEKIIDKRDRKGAGPTAPAKGLTLKVIEYE